MSGSARSISLSIPVDVTAAWVHTEGVSSTTQRLVTRAKALIASGLHPLRAIDQAREEIAAAPAAVRLATVILAATR